MKTEIDVLSTLALVLNKDMFDQVLEWKEDSDKLKELKEAVGNVETDDKKDDGFVDSRKVLIAQAKTCKAIAEDIVNNEDYSKVIEYLKRYYPQVKVKDRFKTGIKPHNVIIWYEDICVIVFISHEDDREVRTISWNGNSLLKNRGDSVISSFEDLLNAIETIQNRRLVKITRSDYTKADEEPLRYITLADSYRLWLDNEH